MVLNRIHITNRETSKTFFRCEHLKKIEKKTCSHPCLRGVRWSQRVKGGLGAFPSFLERFLLVFPLDEGSDPILTPHPHPLDSCLGSGSDRTRWLS